jgi:hypothetical protein
MPKIDFSKIEDSQDYTPVPEDKYLVEVVEVEELSTDHGDEQWKLKMEILEGEYTGRFIYDRLFFTEKAYPRLKLVCGRFGIDVSGEMDLKPEMLNHKLVYVEVKVEDYEIDGKIKHSNNVPFAGYEHTDKVAQDRGSVTAGEPGTNPDGDLPF